eukprot:4532617-Pyramimonas_sp.AAC.1
MVSEPSSRTVSSKEASWYVLAHARMPIYSCGKPARGMTQWEGRARRQGGLGGERSRQEAEPG